MQLKDFNLRSSAEELQFGKIMLVTLTYELQIMILISRNLIFTTIQPASQSGQSVKPIQPVANKPANQQPSNLYKYIYTIYTTSIQYASVCIYVYMFVYTYISISNSGCSLFYISSAINCKNNSILISLCGDYENYHLETKTTDSMNSQVTMLPQHANLLRFQ